MKISVSDLQYFSDCRRQWMLSKSWMTKKPDSKLWLGSIVHEFLQVYYQSHQYEFARDQGINAIKKSFTKLRERFSESWAFIEDEMTSLAETAVGIFDNYVVYDFETPIDGEVFAVESFLSYNLNPEVTLTGKIDLIMRQDSGLWVVDHKTSADAPNLMGLDVDDQLTAYAYLVWKKYAVVPDAVMYNVLIKRLPKEPVVLKAGGLSKAKDQDTIYPLYVEKIVELGLDPTEYSEILEILQNKGWSKFFVREGSTRNLKELEAFQSRSLAKAEDIRRIITKPEVYAYPSPSTYRCGYCPFLQVCKSMDDGGDYQAILQSQFIPYDYDH